MTTRHLLPSLFVLAALLPGCLFSRDTRNEPLDPTRIESLVPGVTTARQVVDILGAPTEVVQLGRRSAYRYDYTMTKETGLLLIVLNLQNKDTRSDRLWAFFDEGEVLTHLGSTLTADHARYAMPWNDTTDPPVGGNTDDDAGS